MKSTILVVALFSFLAVARADEPAWESVSDSGGIHVFKRETPGSDLIAFKGEGTIDAPVARVGSVILDQPRVHEWAQNVEQVVLLKRISDSEVIEYTHVGTPFILKDRDFVTRSSYRVDPKSGSVMFEYASMDYADAPAHGYVRGTVLHSAFELRPIDGGARTLFTGEIHADRKGSVPKWLVNFFQQHWPRKTLEALRKQCGKKDIVENKALVAKLTAVVAPAKAATPASVSSR